MHLEFWIFDRLQSDSFLIQEIDVKVVKILWKICHKTQPQNVLMHFTSKY